MLTRFIAVTIAAIVLIVQGPWANGLRFERPHGAQYHPLDDEPIAGTLLNAGHPALLTLTTSLFLDTAVIDFEKRQLTFVRYDSLGFIIWTQHYGELSDYLNDRAMYALSLTWFRNSLLSQVASGQEKPQDLKLAWELPVQYPSWAQRVLGNEPPRLSINGSLKIKMSYEDITRQVSATDNQAQGPGFVFDESNQFTVTGSVGRLININISANSEGDVDVNNPLKNFKIDYKESKQGELEDEVVQQVTAGYTSFDMPGTQLSGYSESHDGLFGIKVATKFGPLSLTTIASNEQGESQKLSVSNNGSAGPAGTTQIAENKFAVNRYFFLDTTYISYYNRKYGITGGNLNASLPTDLEVDSLEVWLQVNDYDAQKIRVDPTRQVRKILIDPLTGESRQFAKLLSERQYHLERKEGWIRFNRDSLSVNDKDMLAIFLRTKSGTVNKGGGVDSASKFVWVLKPDNSILSLQDDPARFRLMWRNVYDVSAVTDISKFQIQVYHTEKDVPQPQKTIAGTSTYISDALGLTKNAVPLTERKDIFDFDSKELILPPYDTGKYGNEPFANPAFAAAKLSDTLIYRFDPTANELNQFQPLFTIEMSGSSKQTEFDLGLGVMENTVRVTADGTQLTKNIDYVVNVEMGKLELVSPHAKAANKIDVEYQREAMFMPDRKTFLGARAEMLLPFISDKSLLGFSVLWQGTSITQDIPRINQEPYSKLLFDFNAKLDFQPAWMTALVNKIPLIKTDAPSTASIEFETAHSRMNPNTANQAFVDDFESSKQVYSLGEFTRNWYTASPPYPNDSIVNYPPAWDFYWFQPVGSDAANHIDRWTMWAYDSGKTFSGTDRYASVLRLNVSPSPSSHPDLRDRFRNAWAGIMTPIPPGMYDRKRDQYFEVLVKCDGSPAGKGKVRFQMGRIDEDLALCGGPPNGTLDKEDTSRIWREFDDKSLDKGLDTLTDQFEKYLIPNGLGGWDTLGYGDERLNNGSSGDFRKDPAKDNFQSYLDNSVGNYRFACRLEGDNLSHGTEDINNDGTLQTGPELYHEFVIDLADKNSPYIDTTAKLVKTGGWKRYRFPLHQTYSYHDTTIRTEHGLGFDDWHDIRMVRVIWNGFDSASLLGENKVIFSGMQFVGNQWESIRDSSGNSKINVSTVGTQDDSAYQAEVEGMQGRSGSLIHLQKDETNHWQQESSLDLDFHDLHPGDEALAQKSYAYQPLNVASYDSLTLAVSGRPPSGSGPLCNGDVEFVFRFGSDTSTYYEYRQKIMPGWNNFICVKLKELSDLKLARQRDYPNDSIYVFDSSATRTLRIIAPKGRQPNFANITWMAVGVVCKATAPKNSAYDGEIWVDELKVVGIKQFNGWSSRLNVATQWADFLTFSTGFTYQGGDFRTMTDNALSFGDSKLSGNINLNLSLDKFLPRQWGVSIPVGGQISTSLTRPQLKPNTDVYLSDKNNQPDGFLEMAKDVVNRATGHDIFGSDTTDAEHFETQSYSQSVFANYSKANPSTNPVVNLLLDRVSTQFQYSMTTNHTQRGERSDLKGDYRDFDSTRTYSGALKYDLTPRDPPAWTKWRPFGDTKLAWVPPKFKDLEFSLLPSRVNFDLANAAFTNSMQEQDEPGYDPTPKVTRDFTLNHGVQIDYSPIKPLLDMSYTLAINRDFPNTQSLGSVTETYNFLDSQILNRNPTWKSYYILNKERSRTQHLRLSLNPQIFDWLTHTAEYNTDYTGTLVQRGNDVSTDYMTAKVTSGFTFNSTFTVASLLQSSADSSKIGKLAARIKKGFDFVGFSSVNLTYSASSDLLNNYLGTDFLLSNNTYRYGHTKGPIGLGEFTAYQFGLDRSLYDIITGNMNDTTDFGGMRYRSGHQDSFDLYKDDSRRVNQSVQVSTALAFTKPFDLSLSSISLRWNKQYSVLPDSSKFDTTSTDLAHPEFGISAHSSVLEKLKIINKYFDGMGLSSTFSYKRSTTNNFSSAISHSTSYDYAPLVSLDGTLKKWPVKFNYQHTLSQKTDEAGGNSTVTMRDADNVDMNYELPQTSGLSTIKLFKWTIPVRGRTTMGMRLTRDYSTTSSGGITTSDISNLSVGPHLAYVFTDNVTGTLEYTGSRSIQNGQTTTSNIVSLIAEIRF